MAINGQVKKQKNIINQDFKYYELLIINDGSNDSTEEQILKYIKLDDRIKHLPKKHIGLTDSLNYGLKRAITAQQQPMEKY